MNTIGQVRTLYVQKDRIKDIYLAYMLIFNIQYSNWMEIRFIRFESVATILMQVLESSAFFSFRLKIQLFKPEFISSC